MEWENEDGVSPPLPPVRSRGSGMMALVISVIVGAVLGWVLAAVLTYVQPRKYESRSVVQIHADPLELEKASPSDGGVLPPLLGLPEFDFSSELAVLESEQVLALVGERLDLSSRWNMEPQTVVSILQGVVIIEPVIGTELVTIRVSHTNPNDARDIVAEVPDAYLERRGEMVFGRAKTAMTALNAAMSDQEDLVEEKRQLLDTITKAVGADLESHDLNEAKGDYESAVVLNQEMRGALVAARVALKMPRNFLTIHELPKVGRAPVSPNVEKNLSVGLGWGLALGLLVGVSLLLMRQKSTGPRSAGSTSTVPAFEE